MTTLSKARLRYLMPIELIKFLKKEKALCVFMDTFISSNNHRNVTKDYETYLISLLQSRDAFVCSFRWSKYPQKGIDGLYYWEDLSSKWKNHLYIIQLNNK